MCYFIISLASCFLAILVALIANTVIGQAPLLFLKISEISQGEIDITFTPSAEGQYYHRFFNATKIDSLVKDKVALLAPRISFDQSTIYSSKEQNRSVELSFFLQDSQREKKLKIGSKYDPPMLGEGECAIPASIADYLKLDKGEEALVKISISSYYNLLSIIYNSMKADEDEYIEEIPWNTVVTLPCKIASTFDNLGGKVPIGTDDQYMWMELGPFLKHFGKHIESSDEKFKKFVSSFNTYDIVTSLITNHPSREEVYVDSDFINVQKKMAQFSSGILDPLGFYPVVSSMPILKSLLPLSLGAVFLKIILNLVVVLLAAISTFLIYSLLMISVETRTFEMGIFRMLGITKYGLGFLVIVQALMFVAPAFILALASSFPILSVISSLFQEALGFSFTPVPNALSISWAVCIGIFVPLLAAIFPIRTVVNQNLIQSLDTTRSKTQGVHITIEYAQRGSAWGLIAFGVVVIAFGLSIYYFLPLALLSMNLQLLLWIMLAILLSIIAGLIMISLNIQHILERLLIFVFLFCETAAMNLLVLKNMIAHKFRNRRTGIIYSLSLGFLLFAVVAYTMELRNTQLTMLSRHSSYLEVQWKGAPATFSDVVQLEQLLLHNFTTEVEDFSWASNDLGNHMRAKIKDNWITDFGKQKNYNVHSHSISPNFFEVSNDLFLSVFDKNTSSGLALGEQLYTPRGSQSMGVGSFLEQELNSQIGDPKNTYLYMFERATTDLAFESKPLFMLSSCPGFRMVRTVKGYQTILLSFPIFLKYGNYTSYTQIPYDTIMIKIRGEKDAYYHKVFNALQQMSLQRYKIFVPWNYLKEAGNIDNIKFFLDVMFIVIIVLFMFLSFFSLSSSMTANILEQSKELSVVRAVGLSRNRTVLMFIYEAFMLVLSSSLIGSIIGMIVGYTLSLQRALFTDLPVTFAFPYLHLIAMFLTSIICAILSTVSPALYLLKRPIAELAKY